MTYRSLHRRRGITLTDVIVAIRMAFILATFASAGLFSSRGTSNRVKCANNLRQIGLAALMYANNEVPDHRRLSPHLLQLVQPEVDPRYNRLWQTEVL